MADDNNVKKLIRKNQFEKEQNLYDDILHIIDSYQGEISVVSVIGILNLAQDEIKQQARNQDE